jgi:hypothetical protein
MSPRASGLRKRCLLVLVAEGHQDRADRAVVDADHGAGGAVAGGDLLQDQRQRQVVEPGAVPLGGHGHAVAAELGQALELRLGGEVVGLSQAAACGAIFGLHVGAHGVLHGQVVFGEQHGMPQAPTMTTLKRSLRLMAETGSAPTA